MSEIKKRQVFIQLDDDDDEEQASQTSNHPFAPQSSMNDNEENFKMISNISEREYEGFNENLEARVDNLRGKVQIIDQETVETVRENPTEDSENQYQTHFQNIDALQYSSNRSSKNPSQSSNASQRASITSELEVYKAQLASNNTIQNQTSSQGFSGETANHTDNHDTPRISRSNLDLTPEVSQLQYFQNQNQEEPNYQDQTGFQTMDYQAQDQELMERLIQQVLERQENIIYAIGEDAQFPAVESSAINNFQELCQEINNQLQFLFDYYEDLRKTNAHKFNSTNAQRQLIREKENLNTLLKQQTDENKDLQVRIKQYNTEIEDLQKRINQINLENIERQSIILKQSMTSQQNSNQGRASLQGSQTVPSNANQSQNPRTPKHVIKQFIDLDGSPAEEVKQESQSPNRNQGEAPEDKISKLTEIIKQLEKQNQELKEQKDKDSLTNKSIGADSQSSNSKTLIRQKSRENFKSKYYQLSLSNIEESDHESSFTTRQQSQLIAQQDFIWSRKIEERDLTIQSLQDRIRMLMQASQIQVNVINGEPNALTTIGANFVQNNQNAQSIFDNSLAPSRSGSFTFTGQIQGNLIQAASSQNQQEISTPTSQHGVKSKPSLRFLPNQPDQSDQTMIQSNRDLLERSISQAKTIEEILMSRTTKNSNSQPTFSNKISRKGSLSSVGAEHQEHKERKRDKSRKHEHQIQIQSDIAQMESKVEDIGRRYSELLKEHKSLIKEKNILMKLMEEVNQANSNLDADFKVLFKQAKQMSERQREHVQTITLAPVTTHKDRNSLLSLADYLLPKQDTNASQSLINANSQATLANKHQHSRYQSEIQISDMDTLVEYIDSLFREKDYLKAGSLWQKLNYEELPAVKLDTQQEYLRILLVIKDKMLQGQLEEDESPYKRQIREQISYSGPYHIKSSSSLSRSRSRSPQKQLYPRLDIPQQMPNQKLNQLIENHMKNRQQRLTSLESDNLKLTSKLSKLEEQLSSLKTKYELAVGERDSQKRKVERLRQEVDKIKEEHRLYILDQERQKLEMQERHEKIVGKLKQETRRESAITFGGGQVQNKTQTQFENLEGKRFKTQGDEEDDQEEDQYKDFQKKHYRENLESPLQNGKQNNKQFRNEIINSRRTSDNRFDGITDTARMSNMSFKAPSTHHPISKFPQSSREEMESAQSPELNPKAKDKTLGDQQIEDTLRKLYSQFFTSEYKHTQDKIRNKNSIFKELFEIAFNEIEKYSVQMRDLKRKLRKNQAENLEYKDKNQELSKQEELAHSYAIKLIRRFQGELSLSKEHSDDLKNLTLVQLLKQISTIISDIEKSTKKQLDDFNQQDHQKQTKDSKSKKQSEKLLQSQATETYEEFIRQLTKEEVVDMLKELQAENERLNQKLNRYKSELQKIKEELAQTKQINEEIELENTKLKRYCRNVRPNNDRQSKDTSNINSNQATHRNSSTTQQNQKENSQNQSQNISDNGTPLSMAKQTSIQGKQHQQQKMPSQNQSQIEQTRNFDSKASMDNESNQRKLIQQQNNSVVCSEDGSQPVQKGLGTDHYKASKPPREPNIHLFNSAMPKSANPNKKLYESHQKQVLVVKKPVITQVSQDAIPSTYHRNRASNSFYNIQKEIGNISANQLNVNNYFGCATTQHNTLNSTNLAQMLAPQPPSPIIPPQNQQNTSVNTTSNIVNASSIMTNPYYSATQSMTPTQKMQDYFAHGDAAINERQIVTNKSSYQDLHQDQLINKGMIKTGLQNDKHKLIITKAPKNMYKTQLQDHYTPIRNEDDFNKMRSPMTDNQSPKLFNTDYMRLKDFSQPTQKGQNLRNMISGVTNQKNSGIKMNYEQEILSSEYGQLSTRNRTQNLTLPVTQRVHSAKQPSNNDQVTPEQFKKKIVALRQPNPTTLQSSQMAATNFTSLSHRAMANPPSVNEIRGALPNSNLIQNRSNLDSARKYI